jgi:hypothetical protein
MIKNDLLPFDSPILKRNYEHALRWLFIKLKSHHHSGDSGAGGK